MADTNKFETVYFNVGDTVYHYEYGKGIIKDIIEDEFDDTPVVVEFELEEEDSKFSSYFTKEGCISEYNTPELSQKPYDLISGGFSLVAKPPHVPVDTPIFVRLYEKSEWMLRYFKEWKNDKPSCFNNQQTSKDVGFSNDDVSVWPLWSFEIPESK